MSRADGTFMHHRDALIKKNNNNIGAGTSSRVEKKDESPPQNKAPDNRGSWKLEERTLAMLDSTESIFPNPHLSGEEAPLSFFFL